MIEAKEVAMSAIDRTNTKISVKAGEVHELSKSIDPAWSVVGQEHVQYSEEEGRRVLRCIDGHLLPMLMWVYCIQFADKVSLNYASVMGLRTDTHLNPNSQQFSWVGAIFYAGYIFWEYVHIHSSPRHPVRKLTTPIAGFQQHIYFVAYRW